MTLRTRLKAALLVAGIPAGLAACIFALAAVLSRTELGISWYLAARFVPPSPERAPGLAGDAFLPLSFHLLLLAWALAALAFGLYFHKHHGKRSSAGRWGLEDYLLLPLRLIGYAAYAVGMASLAAIYPVLPTGLLLKLFASLFAG